MLRYIETEHGFRIPTIRATAFQAPKFLLEDQYSFHSKRLAGNEMRSNREIVLAAVRRLGFDRLVLMLRSAIGISVALVEGWRGIGLRFRRIARGCRSPGRSSVETQIRWLAIISPIWAYPTSLGKPALTLLDFDTYLALGQEH